jgi:hypothetical protein
VGILDIVKRIIDGPSNDELRRRASKKKAVTCSLCGGTTYARRSNNFDVSCVRCRKKVCEKCSQWVDSPAGVDVRICNSCYEIEVKEDMDSRRCLVCNEVVPHIGCTKIVEIECRRCGRPVCRECAAVVQEDPANEDIYMKYCPDCYK